MSTVILLTTYSSLTFRRLIIYLNLCEYTKTQNIKTYYQDICPFPAVLWHLLRAPLRT